MIKNQSSKTVRAAGGSSFLLPVFFAALFAVCLLLPVRAANAADLPVDTPPAATPSPAAASVPASTPAPTPFTVVWFPDTQNSVYAEPDAMRAMGKWVHDNVQTENIVYVLQTGDLVNNGFAAWEWENFELAYDQFSQDVPYFCVAGNHDLGVKLQMWGGYLARPYVQAVPNEQQFMNGRAAYVLFSAGGTDFLVVGAGYGAEEQAEPWMNETLRQYPDRVAIALFHGYLHARRGLDRVGTAMLEQVVSPNANVRLVLCGHYRGTSYREDVFIDSDTAEPRNVHTMLCNYQAYTHHGGFLRLLTFHPDDRSIEVRTFSALTGHTARDDYFKNWTFVLENAF